MGLFSYFVILPTLQQPTQTIFTIHRLKTAVSITTIVRNTYREISVWGMTLYVCNNGGRAVKEATGKGPRDKMVVQRRISVEDERMQERTGWGLKGKWCQMSQRG